MSDELIRMSDLTNSAVLFLVDGNGQIITQSSPLSSINLVVSTRDIQTVRQQGYFSSLEEEASDSDNSHNALRIRTIVPINNHSSSEELFLQVSMEIPEGVARDINAVTNGLLDYQQIIFTRSGLQTIYHWSLILSLLLAVLCSVLAAFSFASRMTAPIRQLAEGTRRVTGGHFQSIKEFTGADEINELTRAFNVMVRKVNDAMDTLESRRERLEQSNIFRERILENLSTGIIVLDHMKRLRSANMGAVKILGNSVLQIGVLLKEASPTLAELIVPMLSENTRSVTIFALMCFVYSSISIRIQGFNRDYQVFHFHPVCSDILHGRCSHLARYQRKILGSVPTTAYTSLHKLVPDFSTAYAHFYIVCIFVCLFHASYG